MFFLEGETVVPGLFLFDVKSELPNFSFLFLLLLFFSPSFLLFLLASDGLVCARNSNCGADGGSGGVEIRMRKPQPYHSP